MNLNFCLQECSISQIKIGDLMKRQCNDVKLAKITMET